MKTCRECATRKRWLGMACRWCPASKSCHAWGAALTNPCRKDQIVNVSSCSSPFGEPGHYNGKLFCTSSIVRKFLLETIAIRLLQYSATVYQQNVERCFKNVDGIELKRVSNVRCDIVGHNCLAITAVDKKLSSVVIIFRGTNGWSQLITELTSGALLPAVSHPAGGKVMAYFYDAFNQLWPSIWDSIIGSLPLYLDYTL